MTLNAGQTVTTEARLAGCWTTYLGAVHGVLSAAGMTDLSLPEMAGITGMAFHFYMHRHCDAASVTVYDWIGRHQNALDRIGILSEIFHYEPGTRTYDAAKKRAVANIKSSVDRGVGVIAWAIDNGEFGVIYGYDDEDGILLVDGVDKFNRALGSDPMLYANIGSKFPPAPFLHYQIPVEGVAFDREQAYTDSLKFYVQEMEKPFHMSPDFHSGLLAYDNWIQALTDKSYNSFGFRYCSTVYAESKMLAAQYVRQLADMWGGAAGIADAADLFERIAEQFQSIMQILEQNWDGAKHLGKQVTREQAQQIIPYLIKLKALETDSVRILKEAFR